MNTLLIIIGAPIVAAIVATLSKKITAIEYTSVSAIILSTGATLFLAPSVAKYGIVVFSSIFAVDALSMIGMLITSVIGLAAMIYSVGYLRDEVKKEIIGHSRVRQYFVLINLFIAAMLLACASSNPVIMWLAIEATTLSTTFLISFYNKATATEAAWKYLLINSLGLLLGFFGTLLYLTATATAPETFSTWQTLVANSAFLNPDVARIAFVFILIGYGTKVGLAPMHTWLPDAHSKAPVPISALLSGVLLNIALIAVLRFRAITDATAGGDFTQNLLIALGLFSIVIAACIILIQKNYKRMLAYSSIENMGILALGFGFGGVATIAALLHMIYHSLAKSTLFLSSGNIFLTYSSTKIAKIRGVLTSLPVTGVVFFTCILAIAGLPPFGIFFTKLYILFAGAGAHPYIVATALVAFAIVFIGFLRHATGMLFGEPTEDIIPNIERDRLLIAAPIILMTLLATLSVYLPETLATLLMNASKLI